MKKNLMNIVMAMVVTAMFLAPMVVYADTYGLNNVTYSWTNNQLLYIDFTKINNAGDIKTDNNAAHMLAGQIQRDYTAAIPINLQLSINGTSNWFTSFCVDVYQDIKYTNYNNLSVSLVAPSAVYGGLQAAWLYDTYYKTGNSDIINSALQVAIWETIVDSDGSANYNLKSGNFYTDTINANVLSTANSMLANLSQHYDPIGLNGMYAIMHSAGVQDQLIKFSLPGIVGDPPAGTPEPATLILMGIGIIGLAGFRKFRKN